MSPLLLPAAEIEWIDGVPLSKQFGDVYFQTEGGLAESNYVFLEANRLKEKLSDTLSGNETLVVAETGFGSGLNFIACYALWDSLPEPKKRLEFVSIEGFPLAKADIEKSASYFPELSTHYSKLAEQYPNPIHGAHLLQFGQGKVRLRLIFDSLDNALDEYEIRADIWFLDGFAPKINEAMWSEKLFRYLGYYSHPNTSLSTFSSASIIRKSLLAEGFEVVKREGFGPKREMITARRTSNQTSNSIAPPYQPWHLTNPINRKREHDKVSDNSVVVVGAGIAGLVQALTLSRQGYDVLLLDKDLQALAGASSQPQLIMYAKYPRKINEEGKLLLHAHNSAQSFYKTEQKNSAERFWHPVGLAQLAWTEGEQKRQNDFINNYALPNSFVQQLTANEISIRSGIDVESSGIFFEQSGWLDTHAFARFVLQQDKIQFYGNTQVLNVKREDDSWLIDTGDRTLKSNNVVLCNAFGANHLIPELELPLKQLRGQTTQLRSKSLEALSCVLCGEGYLSPCAENHKELHIGATYDLQNKDSAYREKDNEQNIEQLSKWLKGWPSEESNSITGGMAGLRTTCADYTPIAGPTPNRTLMIEQLSGLKNSAKSCQENYGAYHEGLYVNAAYGSKGLTFAPICADLITSHIRRTPSGESHQMQKMLSPSRFLIRKLKKGLIKS